MRLFISTDIEGITGIVSWSQARGPNSESYDWAFARRMYTHDVNAAIRGARAGGAKQIVIKDAHGACKNLLIDELEPGVELISGLGPTPYGMMEGIHDGFDAAALVGYHAMAGAYGLMPHALVGGLFKFWINGQEAGEIAMSAALAGACGVPVVAVTSDDAGCAEAMETIPGVRPCAVKHAMGGFMTRLLHPSQTGTAIELALKEALSSAGSIRPYRIEGAVTMRAQFQRVELAELPTLIPGVQAVDAYTVEWHGEDFLSAARLGQAIFDSSRSGRGMEH